MRKKEKNNREKKNGYSHDSWLKRKVDRNDKKHQLYIFTRGTVENPIDDPHWEHLTGPSPLKGVHNAKTEAA